MEQIYEMYFEDVYRYILSISKNKNIAEDITSETFLKAIKNIDKFDGKKDIRAWLFTIAKNTYYTSVKRENIYTEEIETVEKFDFVDNIINKEQAMNVHKHLHKLKEPYKEVFMLRIFGELSFKEISEIFNKSESFARVTFHRAKNQIINLMEGN